MGDNRFNFTKLKNIKELKVPETLRNQFTKNLSSQGP